jgi:hypothetical protein
VESALLFYKDFIREGIGDGQMRPLLTNSTVPEIGKKFNISGRKYEIKSVRKLPNDIYAVKCLTEPNEIIFDVLVK